GKTCSVVGFKTCGGFLKAWNGSTCEQHSLLLHQDCPCLQPYALYCFPQGEKNEETRRKWVTNLERKNLNPSKHAKVCSIHFVDGRPTETHPYPTLNLRTANEVAKNRGRHKPSRHPLPERATLATAGGVHSSSALSNLPPAVPQAPPQAPPSLVVDCGAPQGEDIDVHELSPSFTLTPQCTCSCGIQKVEVGIQCEVGQQKDHSYCTPTSPVVVTRATRATQTAFSVCDTLPAKQFRFFTGLSKALFEEYTTVVSSKAKTTCKLDVNDQILLTLMRLRLGLLLVDLAFHFQISVGLASKIFKFWIQVLADISRKYLVMWLPQETIASTRPSVFTDFPNTTCIIDCFEIFVDRAQNMLKRGRTYSPYKSHNTAKVLHVIAPNGFIMFMSKAYGGRASDRFITSDSGLLRYLLPGDQILADKGFTIEDMLPHGVKRSLPSFRKQKKQLSEVEVVYSRRLSKLRIHVERSIRRVKCFRFLKYIPSPIFARSNCIDNILTAIAGICNLQPSLINED
ncbi:unnamed protein product, partial [Ixodes hexagonus]